MANRWGIPKEVEDQVIARDKSCVYCGIEFAEEHDSRMTKASWEHIINDITINGVENIALCYVSCNSSKGSKKLEDWLKTDYCIRKKITANSVSITVKQVLSKANYRK